MVQCAALNCTVKSGQGLSMYLFPKNPNLRKTWTLKLKRYKFKPSQYTKLCEFHFEKNQFAVNPDVAAAVGFQTKSKMLIRGAVPTIFDYTDPKAKLNQHGKRSALSHTTTSRKSIVLEKRKRIQVKTHTKVFSTHFKPEDFIKTVTGMTCLTECCAIWVSLEWTGTAEKDTFESMPAQDDVIIKLKANHQSPQCIQADSDIKPLNIIALKTEVGDKHAFEWHPSKEADVMGPCYVQALDQSWLDVSVCLHDCCNRSALQVESTSLLTKNATELKDTFKFDNQCDNQTQSTSSWFANESFSNVSTVGTDLKKPVEKIVVKTDNGEEILIKVELNVSDESDSETGQDSMESSDISVKAKGKWDEFVSMAKEYGCTVTPR